MRISDWSSDVCSSDLRSPHDRHAGQGVPVQPLRPDQGMAAARVSPHRGRRHGAQPLPGQLFCRSRAGSLLACPFEHMGDMQYLPDLRSEEHTSELQSLMRISYAVFCLKKKKSTQSKSHHRTILTKKN